jgi:hypothetical protein
MIPSNSWPDQMPRQDGDAAAEGHIMTGYEIVGDVVIGKCVVCKTEPAVTAGYCKKHDNERRNPKRPHNTELLQASNPKKAFALLQKYTMPEPKRMSKAAREAYREWERVGRNIDKAIDGERMNVARGIVTVETFHEVVFTLLQPVRHAHDLFLSIELPLEIQEHVDNRDSYRDRVRFEIGDVRRNEDELRSEQKIIDQLRPILRDVNERLARRKSTPRRTK